MFDVGDQNRFNSTDICPGMSVTSTAKASTIPTAAVTAGRGETDGETLAGWTIRSSATASLVTCSAIARAT
ncbi:MAG: hypothetical protein MI861_08955, partial [Pirellulales bacterium]|nr:hypothetical protein [Pirellulales bacterium]